MRHQKPFRKLSRQRSHYRALMRNLAYALFQHESIETTLAKAKEVRGFVDQILTLGKDGDLHARRRAFSLLGNKIGTDANGKRLDVLDKVFKEFATRYSARPGGYTRIIQIGRRPGDAAPMAILELIGAVKAVKAEKPSKKSEDESSQAAAAG